MGQRTIKNLVCTITSLMQSTFEIPFITKSEKEKCNTMAVGLNFDCLCVCVIMSAHVI